AEVEYQDTETVLHYIDFPLEGGGRITIATTRPELIGACQAVLVHPGDERHKDKAGRTAILPFYGRKVPIMADENVEETFGTGAVMVCSYGDKQDALWIMKYGFPVLVILDEFGRMREEAGALAGMETVEARNKIAGMLKDGGYYVKGEAFKHSVGVCWRCSTPVEIIEKMQWFLRSVEFTPKIDEFSGRIRWFPGFMKQRLHDWAFSLTWDWVVSRQRLFGTPIPVWECPKCGYVLPAREDQCYVDPVEAPAPSSCPNDGVKLEGSRDVFDTWMDSSLTALYNCFWLRDEALFKRMFPMSLRGQAHEIIRTWAYYTMLRTALLVDDIPWKDIMITGFIMAPDWKPMHTHLGNVIDPVPLIEKYGADALRYYAATCTLGEDTAFRERDVIHGQRLCNKLWNMSSFVASAGSGDPSAPLSPVDEWIAQRYDETVREATEAMEAYSFERAIRAIEQFAWHDFADNYIEMVKGKIRKGNGASVRMLGDIMLGILRLFSPFLPHVTEACYQHYFRGEKVSIHLFDWPSLLNLVSERNAIGRLAVDVVSAVRTWRAEADFRGNIAELHIYNSDEMLSHCLEEIKAGTGAMFVKLHPQTPFSRKIAAIRPNYNVLGPRYRERAGMIAGAMKNLSPDSIELDSGGRLVLNMGDIRQIIDPDCFEVEYSYDVEGSKGEFIPCGEMLLTVLRS
ncbi:MAG: class I tRNA ligase family protein, partial [Methanomassiliicoccales archaeon]